MSELNNTSKKNSQTKPRILAVANQKGGVGKTTTAINLGTALAAIGENVLILDLDPQGNASTGLGISNQQRSLSTYHLLSTETLLSKTLVPTSVPRLFIVPSTMDLLGIELELSHKKDRAYALKHKLSEFETSPLLDHISYVLIDCPPSLNLLTINALVSSHSILVPLQCEFFALEGLSQLLRTVDHVKANLNRRLTIQGIVLTMYDPRNNLSNQVVSDVRQFMGDAVYHTIIPRNVRISEAPSHGKPVLLYDLKCPGSQAYLKLASEVIKREAMFLYAA